MFRHTRRWSKSFDIFDMEKIFFPINISNHHWVLVIALMQERRIIFRDALGAEGQKYVCVVFGYIIEEMKTRKGHVMLQEEQDEWVLEFEVPGDSPRQDNGFDCGMFVCMYADYMLQDLPEQFNQQNMPMLRGKFCYCVLTGNLIYTV